MQLDPAGAANIAVAAGAAGQCTCGMVWHSDGLCQRCGISSMHSRLTLIYCPGSAVWSGSSCSMQTQ